MRSELDLQQPFRTDLEYYEERAEGIATVEDVSVAAARRELARRHGFLSWPQLCRHVEALRRGEEPPTPFMLAYSAVEAGERGRLVELLDRHPELVHVRGTNGNDLLGMAADLDLVRLLLERGADPNRGNVYGWTKLHQAGYSNSRELAQLMLEAGARTDLFARGDGGTPLVVALFWGHREVVDLLGREPRTCASQSGSAFSTRSASSREGRRPALTVASTAPTAASPPGSRPTTRRRSSTRRWSGPQRADESRRSTSSSSWARGSTPIPTAAPLSRGPPSTAVPRRSVACSSSVPIPTAVAPSAARRTGKG